MRTQLTLGILAHVDAGKTTLSEAMLYQSGRLRRLGRVDHKDAFLDTEPLERERGITIFSKQAVFPLGERDVTLLDTPGHADFSSEMERTLQVLDCAVLVISGTDGVQAHTRTLWRLLERYQVPTFLFVNKMDLPGADRETLLAQLRSSLDDGCVDFSLDQDRDHFYESAAMCSEEALEHYLSEGTVPEDALVEMVARRQLFPCWFGSALRLEGVAEFLEGLERYAPRPRWPEAFGARIYKVARDSQGTRLTYLKVTGGSLRVKQLLTNRREDMEPEAVWEEKADQLRIYSGSKFQTVEEAPAGTVCAVTGLSRTFPGQGLGIEPPGAPPSLEPVLTYRVLLPEGTDPHTALAKLRLLEEEDPQLHVVWREQLREIHVQLMGEVQLDILQSLLAERFGLEVSFDAGGILYRETIAAPVEGVGHYEPLRHYAEVHLLLEPGERGSGLRFAAACPPDMLEGHWQRLVLTHLEEREHLGVLTGSPITDMKITLVAGRAHLKHTEGGDFRQATYRAVRQGLMEAESILLEPWYDFRLELPAESVGRALSDLQRMAGETAPPELEGEEAVLTGRAPVACLRDYGREVTAYTRGRGRLFCTLGGYAPCHDQEAVVAALDYDPERDLEQPADSVFCDHGAGYTVKWDQVKAHMHVDSGLRLGQEEETEAPAAHAPAAPATYSGAQALDKELQAIYERTYGPVKRRDLFQPAPRPERTASSGESRPRAVPPRQEGPEYLLVDGYNIIFAWEELQAVARDNLDAARQLLMDLLSNYQGFKKCVVILVFDVYKVPRGLEEVIRYHNIYVVYTKEAETADAYIEKATFEIGKKHRVKVATSDGAEQLIILGHGALRLSATAFRAEVEQVEGEIAGILARNNRRDKARPIQTAMDRAKGRKPSS
ncbi:MAG TPA: TetM/TetW/TetO/TetS family tetracycline resistance ribosomal protection protein [Candidatus Intestinimonas pullistercoris]|uniref:TetM/TetW/TetO/TetS family tetracycline resistance ribosomal protection protein n=3 Tax=Intestinimonas TaxID=1392389 RepID=A0A9D2NZD6_9FIRM|nr:TetM/TetW/TetO/TetS family tetracycline resistance ribosomal protection protein [Candidatus Intestinimonas pullistercoris]